MSFSYLGRRYDSHAHSLIDAPAEGIDYEIFPGQDYSNPRVKDFSNGKNSVKLDPSHQINCT